MEIISGIIPCAKKVVIYGPEGIGKSTFASYFPDPLFIDTEGSTNSMDVKRLKKPTSWHMLLDEVDYIKTHPDVCKTLVIDTIDWAESLCVQSICDKHQKSGIEDFGYGNGYVYAKEEMGRFLNRLSDVVESDINVVLTAHAQIRKFEQPDELGAYDRWELKLGKKTASQTSPLIKEWADMLLFANYKTFSVAADDKGKKRKVQGGERVMYTSHHACWDAKNRYGLPEQVPFHFSSIAHIIGKQAESTVHEQKEISNESGINSKTEKKSGIQPTQNPANQMVLPIEDTVENQEQDPFPAQDPEIPKALRDLMESNRVMEWDIQNVVAARGYYPSDVRIKDYDRDFIDGCLVGAWPQVFAMIKEMREKQEIPFN